ATEPSRSNPVMWPGNIRRDWIEATARRSGGRGERLAYEMFGRFLLSCLVDADYLDTEAHFRPYDATRRRRTPTLATVAQRTEQVVTDIVSESPDTPVNRARNGWAEGAIRAGRAHGPGLYRLTGGVGVGKTIGGLRAALAHAQVNTQRRLIVAAPYMGV